MNPQKWVGTEPNPNPQFLVSLHRFFINFALVNSSNKCPVSRFGEKNALVLLFYTVLVVEEVGG